MMSFNEITMMRAGALLGLSVTIPIIVGFFVMVGVRLAHEAGVVSRDMLE